VEASEIFEAEEQPTTDEVVEEVKPEISKTHKRKSPARYHRMSLLMENVRIAPIVYREVGNEWAHHYARDINYLLKLLELAEDKLAENNL
jgi:hypothetical protein